MTDEKLTEFKAKLALIEAKEYLSVKELAFWSGRGEKKLNRWMDRKTNALWNPRVSV